MVDHKVFNGNKLLTLRNQAQLTQKSLAEKLQPELGNAVDSISAAISTYETGRVQPKSNVVEALSNLFEIPVEEFYRTDHGEIRINTKVPSKKRTIKKKPVIKRGTTSINEGKASAQLVAELTSSRLNAAEEAEVKNRMTLTVIGEFFDSSTYIAQNNEGDLFKVSPLNEW